MTDKAFILTLERWKEHNGPEGIAAGEFASRGRMLTQTMMPARTLCTGWEVR